MQSLPIAHSSLVSNQISVHLTLQIDAKWPIVKILTGWVDCLWVDLPSSPMVEWKVGKEGRASTDAGVILEVSTIDIEHRYPTVHVCGPV